MLKGHVFEYQQFQHQIFAIFIHLFMNKANGVARSYKNAMNITYSGHTVTVDKGACIVQGRVLEEDASTTIDAGIETAFCKLVVEIDLDKVNTITDFNQGTYRVVKGESAYPNLTQEDTAGTNAGKYQYELARFKISNGSVTEFQDKRTYIEDQLKYGGIERAQSAADDAQNTADTARSEAAAANNNANSRLPINGGNISGGIAPDTNNAYDLGTVFLMFRTIYANELNGKRFYGEAFDFSNGGYIGGDLDVERFHSIY